MLHLESFLPSHTDCDVLPSAVELLWCIWPEHGQPNLVMKHFLRFNTLLSFVFLHVERLWWSIWRYFVSNYFSNSWTLTDVFIREWAPAFVTATFHLRVRLQWHYCLVYSWLPWAPWKNNGKLIWLKHYVSKCRMSFIIKPYISLYYLCVCWTNVCSSKSCLLF